MNKILNKVLPLICASLLIATASFAQKATFKGAVVDSTATGENFYLFGASIEVADQDGKYITGTAADQIAGVTGDKDAGFEISLDPGSYIVTIRNLNFKDRVLNLTFKAGDTWDNNINMTQNLLEQITVTGSKSGSKASKETVSISSVGAGLIDNTAATKVDDAVGKVPGVNVVDGQANIRGGSGYSYGAGSRVLIMVDGIPFMQGDAGLPNWRDIPVENIDKIEILKGAASALYGSSALNGIINVRTAYARNKPVGKFAIWYTGFGNTARPETQWWTRDSINVRVDGVDTTIQPRTLAGPLGYRTPMEAGAQFAYRCKIGEKFDLTSGGNLFYMDSPLGGVYERKVRFNTNLRYRFSDSLNIGAAVNFNHGLSGSFFVHGTVLGGETPLFYVDTIQSEVYLPLAGANTVTKTTRFAIDPFLTAFDKIGNQHRVQGRMFYVDNDNGNNQGNQSIFFYLEYQNQSTFHKLGGLELISGAVGQYTTVDAELYGNAKYSTANAAGYFQLKKGFFQKPDSEEYRLTLTAGGRIEMNAINSPDSVAFTPPTFDANGNVLTPATYINNPEPNTIEAKPVFRVGANYELTETTFLRASWGQGYRYPTIAERYISTQIDVLGIRPNPTLESETGWSAELGIKQGFSITEKWLGFADASFFLTEYQNMMEFTFGGGNLQFNSLADLYFQSVNIGNTRIMGAELEVMGTGTIGNMATNQGVRLNLLAGYTFIDPKFQDFDSTQQALSSSDKNILKFRNRHMVKFDLEGFFLKNRLSFGVSLQYNSAMEAVDAVFEDLFFADPVLNYDFFGIGSYRSRFNRGEAVNLGARIAYRHAFKDEYEKEKLALKLSLVGNNLLNQEYAVRPGLMGRPMNFTVRLDVEF
ncbi:MAG: TonB-dependent receptor [Saprospiraceae bacterium]|nr:TonB-dependent receptor [Saprospiraceae bacterium]